MDWKKLIGSIAPGIATALGGPAAGLAVKFLANNLLGDENASQEDVENALAAASPETMLKLKELDVKFKLDMRKLGIDVFRLETEDRNSARKMFGVNIWPQIGLSGLFIVGYFIILYFVMVQMDGNSMDEGVKALMFTLIGVITGEVPRIMAFWFGSSMGSKEKDKK